MSFLFLFFALYSAPSSSSGNCGPWILRYFSSSSPVVAKRSSEGLTKQYCCQRPCKPLLIA